MEIPLFYIKDIYGLTQGKMQDRKIWDAQGQDLNLKSETPKGKT